MQPKNQTTRAPAKRKLANDLPIGAAGEQVRIDAGDSPTLAMLWADEQTPSARIGRLVGELRDTGQFMAATVLEQVAASLSGNRKAVAAVAKMARLTRSKRKEGVEPKKKGAPRKTATSIFEKLHSQVARWHSDGVDDVRIAKAVVAVFEKWLGPSPHAAALLADDSKLAKRGKLAGKDPKKCVKAVHRDLGHPGTDNLDASKRTADRREREVKKKARANSVTKRLSHKRVEYNN